MIHQDLGRIDAPMVIFGGPYSNLQALEALFTAHPEVPAGQMICTGDVVAYCADAAGCAQAMRERGILTVKGNCEAQLGAGEADCGCGFDEGSTCSILSIGWFAHADRQMTAADRDWMMACPDIVTFTQAGRRFAVIHGGFPQTNKFLWSTSTDADFAPDVAAISDKVGQIDAVLAGHSGIPFTKQTGGVEWINCGVIGMPPHDGQPETRYAVLQDGRIAFHRLGYDHAGAAAAMEQAGLTQGYHEALLSGIWPSENILPPALRLRARTGDDAPAPVT